MTQDALTTWRDFTNGLAAIEDKMLAKIPQRLKGDPQVLQECYQLMLAATARTAIDALIGDRDQPVFVPEINLALNIYQPNADTLYRSALISKGGAYRIRGRRGSILFCRFGQLGPDMIRTGQPVAALCYLDLDQLKLDKDGRFDFILSPERPAGHAGDWWQLDPLCEKIMVRQVSTDWTQADPAFSIERLDAPTGRRRLSAGEMSARLAELPGMIANASTFFVDHVQQLRDGGHINRFKEFDVQQMSGLHGQYYYEGAYDLADDEALIVTAKVTEPCLYWSLILTNDVYQTTDWYNNQSSLNGAQARLDGDGMFRIVISAGDPGVPNWLDTAGFRTGAIQGRWLETPETPMPSVEKVKLSEVRSKLPADTPVITPTQREQAIRDRRSAVQQRPLW